MKHKYHYHGFLNEILEESDDPDLVEKIFKSTSEKDFEAVDFCFAKFTCQDKTAINDEEVGYLISKLDNIAANLERLTLLTDQMKEFKKKIENHQPLFINEISPVFIEFHDLHLSYLNQTKKMGYGIVSISNSLKRYKVESMYRFLDIWMRPAGRVGSIKKLSILEDEVDSLFPDFLFESGIRQWNYLAMEQGSKFNSSCKIVQGNCLGRHLGGGIEQIWKKGDTGWKVVFQSVLWVS